METEKNQLQNTIEQYKKELLDLAARSVQINPPQEEELYPEDEMDQELDTYLEFINKNQKLGTLKIQATTASQAIPISGVEITIWKRFRDGIHVFYTLTTDQDGIIDNIILPAPDASLSQSPYPADPPFVTYSISASHPNYQSEEFLDAPVFDNIKSIQPVELMPING